MFQITNTCERITTDHVIKEEDKLRCSNIYIKKKKRADIMDKGGCGQNFERRVVRKIGVTIWPEFFHTDVS